MGLTSAKEGVGNVQQRELHLPAQVDIAAQIAGGHLVYGRGQHVGHHGDHSAPAQRHHRVGLIVVAGIERRARAEGGEALHLPDIAGGFLDAADHRVLEQFRHRFRAAG